MATILQFHGSHGIQPLFRASATGGGRESRSGFEEILALACEHIDAVFGVPQSPREQRNVPRQKVALRAQCLREDGTSPCLISDVSEGGMAFVCGHTHDIGDRIHIQWEGAHGAFVQVDCVVRHVTGPYIGVQFLGATPEQQRGMRPLGPAAPRHLPDIAPSRYVA